MSSRKTILVILLVIINVMAALYTKASINPMNSAQVSTVNAGTIHGPAAVCTNQSTVVYFVDAIPGVINYAWTLPAGATVVSGQGTSLLMMVPDSVLHLALQLIMRHQNHLHRIRSMARSILFVPVRL